MDGGDCCASGVCPRGQCSDPSTLSTCAQEGAACASTSDCCGNSAFGSQLDCLPRGADGGNLCHLAKAGELCDVAHHCLPGVNCVYPPPPDAGAGDGGVDDGGTTDAGSPPPDAGTGAGVCTITKTGTSCTLYTPNCGAGDGCNPSSSTNQGYDPCYLKVNGTNLADRTSLLLCNGGYCAQPNEGDPCSSTCTQTVGDPRRTSCLSFYDNSKLCMPACSTDADCHGASFYDGSQNNPQRVTNYCVNYGNGAGCQPLLCFVEGQAGPAGKVASLYKPCMGHPNTLCLPRFVGADSNIEGYCIAVKPGTAPTVGQVCDPRAGREALAANCGKDAVCLGGRCAAVCDASALGLNGTPGCSKDQTCISPQGLDLIADYQFGGCADGCDPFTDLEHSGCVNYCGGSGAVCNWIIGDPVPNLPRGYCGAALKQPIRIGQACSTDTAVDQCEAGSYCLLGGVRRTCTRLCDPTVDAGTPDACASGQSCTAFTRLPRSGYCH